MKEYRVIRPFETYRQGDIITPTGGMAHLFMLRGLIQPVEKVQEKSKPVNTTKRRGRPRKDS